MTEQQMNYMIALVEEGSFSKAANRLFVSQPSISQLIKKIELQLGTPLIERGHREIILTPAGESFYNTAKKYKLRSDSLKMLFLIFVIVIVASFESVPRRFAPRVCFLTV